MKWTALMKVAVSDIGRRNAGDISSCLILNSAGTGPYSRPALSTENRESVVVLLGDKFGGNWLIGCAGVECTSCTFVRQSIASRCLEKYMASACRFGFPNRWRTTKGSF